MVLLTVDTVNHEPADDMVPQIMHHYAETSSSLGSVPLLAYSTLDRLQFPNGTTSAPQYLVFSSAHLQHF